MQADEASVHDHFSTFAGRAHLDGLGESDPGTLKPGPIPYPLLFGICAILPALWCAWVSYLFGQFLGRKMFPKRESEQRFDKCNICNEMQRFWGFFDEASRPRP
jgi:hypothetical protein